MTDKKVELKSWVNKEADLQLLQDEINYYKALINKAEDNLFIKNLTIDSLQK